VPAERATGIDDFSRICDGGSAFRGSPPYQGNGPVMSFVDGSSTTSYENPLATRSTPCSIRW
jgi:hypothetical protein